MKKLVLISAIALMTASAASASVFDDFRDKLQSQYMKPFARDIGGLLGAADFHSGRTVGFPGFDVGVTGSVQATPSSDNGILRDSGVKMFGLPLVQATVGLPYNIDVSARGMSMAGATIIGGGIKYGVFRHDLAKMLPDVSVGAFYDSLSQDYVKMNHFSTSLAASFDLPIVKPFASAGMDWTHLEAKVDGGDVTSGASVNTAEPRFSVGVGVTPFPLVYAFGAYNWLHGNSGFELGAGVRF